MAALEVSFPLLDNTRLRRAFVFPFPLDFLFSNERGFQKRAVVGFPPPAAWPRARMHLVAPGSEPGVPKRGSQNGGLSRAGDNLEAPSVSRGGTGAPWISWRVPAPAVSAELAQDLAPRSQPVPPRCLTWR